MTKQAQSQALASDDNADTGGYAMVEYGDGVEPNADMQVERARPIPRISIQAFCEDPNFTSVLQVAAEDCTGCSVCVQVCPAKDKESPGHKAIDMAPLSATARAIFSAGTDRCLWLSIMFPVLRNLRRR